MGMMTEMGTLSWVGEEDDDTFFLLRKSSHLFFLTTFVQNYVTSASFQEQEVLFAFYSYPTSASINTLLTYFCNEFNLAWRK